MLKMLKHSDRRNEVESDGLVSRSAVSEFYVSHPFACQRHEWVQSLCLKAVTFAIRSKAWVCGRWLAGTAGSNPAGEHGCLSSVSVVCCQVEVFATS